AFWRGRRVFITGHTGFKGCWLMLWLESLGAEVYGYSLPPLDPSLFKSVTPDGDPRGVFADIRDADKLSEEMAGFEPQIVFHLAAQPLVRESYRQPVLTYGTNVMGSVNLLEAIRGSGSVKSAVVITTDKCYKDMNWERGYRESDTLGGADPYSSSKACVELLCEAWRRSYFNDGRVRLATARAGNVIGGGDWAADRIVPDAMRAFLSGQTLAIRMPDAVRPWQHVLEPLYGYMLLAERLWEGDENCASAWNFGPRADDAVSVECAARHLCDIWGGGKTYETAKDDGPHESRLLRLDSGRAARELGWTPRYNFTDALKITAEWYKRVSAGEDALSVTLEQIKEYMDGAGNIGQ
ncbi:MAG: CDP-glucose 4,6-dehydratase, partial [Clostridiales bacterium]|nr:CDP-glucose 4,6-dehydratase [Clostridiales bacterium]